MCLQVRIRYNVSILPLSSHCMCSSRCEQTELVVGRLQGSGATKATFGGDPGKPLAGHLTVAFRSILHVNFARQLFLFVPFE